MKKFRCRSGECIERSLACNGNKDCIDNSDEERCNDKQVHQKRCFIYEFACKDGEECIEAQQHCDGITHCKDKSDETDCPSQNTTDQLECHKEQYRCTDGKCIDLNSFCDGENNLNSQTTFFHYLKFFVVNSCGQVKKTVLTVQTKVKNHARRNCAPKICLPVIRGNA